MSIHRRSALIAGGLALGAIVVSILTHIPDREPLLLDRAQRVNLSDIDVAGLSKILWISDREAIIRRVTTPSGYPGGCVSYYRRDLPGGTETPIPTLNAIENASKESTFFIDVSPDGQRLLFGSDVVDQNGKILYDAGQNSHLEAWAGDASHVLCTYFYFGDKRSFMYSDIITLKGPTVVKTRIADPPPSSIGVDNHSMRYVQKDLLFNVSNWYALGNDLLPYGKPKFGADVSELRSDHNQLIRKTYVAFPPDHWLHSATFNNGGDRIAWTLQYRIVSPITDLLHRILHIDNGGQTYHESLWVSRKDGSQMHEIGYCKSSGSNAIFSVPGDSIESVSWIPGDKKIAFRYQNHYYTVPTD